MTTKVDVTTSGTKRGIVIVESVVLLVVLPVVEVAVVSVELCLHIDI